MKKLIISPNANIGIISFSSSDTIIDNSYLPFDIVPKIVVIAKKIARTPKSLGV